MNIIISPWSRPLRNGVRPNPKDYPFWRELVALLAQEHHIIQVGVAGEEQLLTEFEKNLPLRDLRRLILSNDTWISVDNFFHHLAWSVGKVGIAIFGKSDPRIFGHAQNINIFKSVECFRKNQFGLWEEEVNDPATFVPPQTIAMIVGGLDEQLKKTGSINAGSDDRIPLRMSPALQDLG
jgi:hypothetical protein